MTDLADFLLARIAEDEAAAKEAGANVWTEQSSGVLDTGEWPDGVHALGDSRVTRFIAEHDPVRVLAECDFKRHLVRQAQGSGQPLEPVIGDVISFPLGVLLAMAQVYSAHDDYRDEWRPEVLEPRPFGELTVDDDGAPTITFHLDVE